MLSLLSLPKEVLLCEIFSRVNYIPSRWLKDPEKSLGKLFYGSIHDILDEYDLEKVCREGDFFSVFYCSKNVHYGMGMYGASYSGNEDLIELIRSKQAFTNNDGFLGACEGGHIDLVRRFKPPDKGSSREMNKEVYSSGIFLAAENDHKEVTDYLLAYSDIQVALSGACAGAKRELIEDLISRGAEINHEVLKYASKSGNLMIVRYILSRIDFVNYSFSKKKFWTRALIGSIESGNLDMVKLIYKEMGYFRSLFRLQSLVASVRSGKIDVVKFMLKIGYEVDEHSLIVASQRGELWMVRFLILRYRWHKPWSRLLTASATSGNLELVKFIRDRAAKWTTKKEKKRMDQSAIIGAAYHGRRDVFEFLLKKLGSLSLDLLIPASSGGYLSISAFILEEAILTLDDAVIVSEILNRSLSIACRKNSWGVVDWLLEKGAVFCDYCEKSARSHLRFPNSHFDTIGDVKQKKDQVVL